MWLNSFVLIHCSSLCCTLIMIPGSKEFAVVQGGAARFAASIFRRHILLEVAILYNASLAPWLRMVVLLECESRMREFLSTSVAYNQSPDILIHGGHKNERVSHIHIHIHLYSFIYYFHITLFASSLSHW